MVLYKATPEGIFPLSESEIKNSYSTPPGVDFAKVKKEETLKQFEIEVNRYLNSFAATRGYDGVNSATKYINIQDSVLNSLTEVDKQLVLKFKNEAQYILQMNSLVWAKYISIVKEIETGSRPLPSSFNEIKQELPKLTWPV